MTSEVHVPTCIPADPLSTKAASFPSIVSSQTYKFYEVFIKQYAISSSLTFLMAVPFGAFLSSSSPAVPAEVTTWYPLGPTSANELVWQNEGKILNLADLHEDKPKSRPT